MTDSPKPLRPCAARLRAMAEHPLFVENAEALDRYVALLEEDQALRSSEMEIIDPTRRRLRISCNTCDTPFCCNQRVDVNLVEAMVVYRWAAEHARPLLDEACRRGHALHQRKTPYDVEAFFRRGEKCPFLVKGKCAVYAVRPWTCRTHYMASAPIKCRDELVPKETFAQDPDPNIHTDVEKLAEDVLFFAQIPSVGTVELAEMLHLIDLLVTRGVVPEPGAALGWDTPGLGEAAPTPRSPQGRR